MEIYENTESVHKLNTFWEQSKVEISNIKTDQITFKSQDLPLARIKKIMKLDEDVKSMMISAEAPILFAKAAEFFIREITLRAWIHTERNKRRTLQRSDITLAVADGDTDQFDFLIDIVPRDEIKSHGAAKREETVQSQPMHQMGGGGGGGLSMFGGNTIHLTAPGMSSSQQSLLSGLVNSASANNNSNNNNNSNMLQSHHLSNNNNSNNNNQVQYVLQLPSGTSLGGGQTIQIQMISPQQQQNMMSNVSGDNNGQQMFTLNTNNNNNSGTVLLQQSQLYASNSSSPSLSIQQQQQHQSNNMALSTAVNSCAVTTAVSSGNDSGSGGQCVLTTVKRDMNDEEGAEEPTGVVII